MAETVVDIFQTTRQVSRCGLLYVGRELSPDAIAQNPDLQKLKDGLGSLGTGELAELILERSANYSSRSVGVRLAVMVEHYLDRQNEAATELLSAGPVTVTRREKSRSYAITDLREDEPDEVAGPVTGVAGEVQVGLGWFNLVTKEMEVTIQPLDFTGSVQVDIAVGDTGVGT